jgi:NAD(P)H-dependent FMN reductase
MSKHYEIAIIVGSLRKESITRKVAHSLIENAPESFKCTFLEIGDLALYNEDLETANAPASWLRFRQNISTSDAVLFLTPEYNRSLSGCIKNAIDVGSRPEGMNVFDGKPAGVVSVTPYKMGAFGANHILRQSLVYLNMPVMQQPEAYIGGAAELFNQDGSLKTEETKQIFTTFMKAYEKWIVTISAGTA